MKKRRMTAFFALFAVLAVFLAGCGGKNWGKIGKTEEPIDLPTIYIETEGAQQIVSRSEYIAMTLTAEGTPDGAYDLQGAAGKIRGRGNSTWDFCEKKSYRIKLELKTNLLGTGDGGDKDWALISCAREKSFLRNYAMFYLAKEIGMEAVTDCSFVQLYLNGEYNGLYMLCETVEFGENRLDLEDEGEETDISYLLELDKRAKSEAESELEYFYVNDWAVPFAIKSHVENAEQTAFIKEYVEKVDDAVMAGDRDAFLTLADLDSFVDMYLLQEFSKNRDVGFASFYLYKAADGKLKCGFPWDFDMALGNDSGEDRFAEEDSPKLNYKDPEGIMAAVLNRWFEALCEYEWFMEPASERWQTVVSPSIEKTVERTVRQGYAMRLQAEQNYDRWKIMGKKQLFEPTRVVMITSYTGQVDYLADWMTERKLWLDDYFEELS